jgi:hypothetical protein
VNEDELRALVRAAIQRHLSTSGREASTQVNPTAEPVFVTERALGMSFAQYRIERAAGDTMCIIEPAVQCNHCGFCKCHGH